MKWQLGLGRGYVKECRVLNNYHCDFEFLKYSLLDSEPWTALLAILDAPAGIRLNRDGGCATYNSVCRLQTW